MEPETISVHQCARHAAPSSKQEQSPSQFVPKHSKAGGPQNPLENVAIENSRHIRSVPQAVFLFTRSVLLTLFLVHLRGKRHERTIRIPLERQSCSTIATTTTGNAISGRDQNDNGALFLTRWSTRRSLGLAKWVYSSKIELTAQPCVCEAQHSTIKGDTIPMNIAGAVEGKRCGIEV